MRTWRKLHASILDSADIANLSDGAVVLLTLLIAAQDDSGYYPWNPTKIKRLTITRSWDSKQTSVIAQELCSAGIARFADNGIILLNGQKLNGKPRKDVEDDLYSRAAMSTPREHDVDATLLQSRVEKSREEESRREGMQGGTQPVWTPPDWFVPLTLLSGYKTKNYGRQAEGILAACAESGAVVEEVIAGFAHEWPTLKLRYNWHDPVATLRGQPLRIAIEKSVNGAKPNGTSRLSAAQRPKEPQIIYTSPFDADGNPIPGR